MKINLRAMSLFVFFAVLLSAHVAFATTYTVDIFTDDNDAFPGDDHCAGGPGGCSLRAAIEEANAHAGDDTIMLPEGTFVLDNVGGFPEDDAASGDLDILSNVTIIGAGASKTIIDGNATDRVFSTFPADAPVVQISNLTVQNGLVESDGGAFYLAGGTITLEGLAVVDNHTDYDFFFGATPSGCGGAISSANTHLIIRNSTFSGNSTGDGYDGADGFNPARSGSESGSGGAICTSSGSIEISNSTFANNATGNGGDGGNNPVAAGANGTDAGVGGALYVYGSASVLLNNVTIVQNRTGTGGSGGLGSVAGAPGEDGDGAGIYVSDIVPGALVLLSNTLLAGNQTSPAGEGPNCYGTISSDGHNLVQDHNECEGFSEGDGDLILVDPVIAEAGLANNGGETQTVALQVTSPAVNAGDVESCTELDQRGVPRSGTCDIGAFEYEAFCGDAVVQSGEECDDGNDDEADACDNSCLSVVAEGLGSVDDAVGGSSAASSGGCSLNANGAQTSEITVFAVISILFGIAYLTRRRCVG